MLRTEDKSPVQGRISRFGNLLTICFLLVVFIQIGHDLSYAIHYNDVQQSEGDWVADKIEDGSPIRRIAFTALLIWGAGVLFAKRATSPYRHISPVNAFLAVFVVFALLSVLWSSDPSLTLRRVIEYVIISIGATAAGKLLGLLGTARLAFAGSTVFLALGFICELALGTFHPLSVLYRFCGTLHPNHQGWNCVLLLLSGSVFLERSKGPSKFLIGVIMLASVALLLLTKSRTSLVCGMVALAFFWAGRMSSRRRIFVIIVVTSIVISLLTAVWLFMPNVATLFSSAELAGRGEESTYTLTGRLPLWQLCFSYFEKQPLTGYGFNSFWTPNHIRDVSDQLEWGVPHSHNGFVELLLGVGAIGTALYVGQLVAMWISLKRLLSRTGDSMVRFYIALLLFYILTMSAEALAFSIDAALPEFCLLCLFWNYPQFAADALRQGSLVTKYLVPAYGTLQQS